MCKTKVFRGSYSPPNEPLDCDILDLDGNKVHLYSVPMQYSKLKAKGNYCVGLQNFGVTFNGKTSDGLMGSFPIATLDLRPQDYFIDKRKGEGDGVDVVLQ